MLPLATLILATLTAGCSDQSETREAPQIRSAAVATVDEDETSPAVPSAETSSPTADQGASDRPNVPARESYAGLRFTVPSGWKELELTAMQRGFVTARFTVPDISEDLTLTLSRSGGTIEDNLDRWRGQVEAAEPERAETVKVAGTDASLIDLTGRFSAGFGREPEDGWRMIGVIVPMEPQSYFIKLTGPADAVAKVEDAFRTFLDSARPE